MLFDVTQPDDLRQFAQWHKCPLRFVNRSPLLMVTVIPPHRHAPVMPVSKLAISWSFGSPAYGATFGAVKILAHVREAGAIHRKEPMQSMTITQDCPALTLVCALRSSLHARFKELNHEALTVVDVTLADRCPERASDSIQMTNTVNSQQAHPPSKAYVAPVTNILSSLSMRAITFAHSSAVANRFMGLRLYGLPIIGVSTDPLNIRNPSVSQRHRLIVAGGVCIMIGMPQRSPTSTTCHTYR